jgi:DNA-binding IclR family transcriptional regulator
VDALLAKLDVAQSMQLVVTETKGKRHDLVAWQVRQWLQVERDLNAVAAKGYAIAVRPIILTTTNFSLSEFTQHFLAPMESVGSGPKLQYRTIQATSLPALSEQVNKAAEDGWSVVSGLFYGDEVVILQKEAAL